MNEILQTVNKLAARLQELQPMKPEYEQKLNEKIRLEFNYNSNHMEGNTLTYGETKLLLIFDKTSGDHELREYEEMKSHDVAFEMIKELAADKERLLSEKSIKDLHEVLLVRPFWKEASTADGQPTRRLIKVGAYKEFPNSVRLQNGEMFHYSSPEDTPIQMGELIELFRAEEQKAELHPVTLAALLHYRFVRIHPFDDGNGRIGRLLMNYVLLKNNLPPVIIKSADKKDYLFALNRADAGDTNAFVDYIAGELIRSLELSVSAAEGENIDEQEDWEKKVALLKRQKNDETVVPKSVAAVLDIIYYSIIPLIDKVIKKLSVYDELFAEKKILFGNRSGARLIMNTDAISKLIKDDNDSYMRDVSFRYQLNGYKQDGTNTFYTEVELNWHFDDFKFRFLLNHNDYEKAIVSLYQKNLSTEEIDSYANECGRIIMKKIESQIRKK